MRAAVKQEVWSVLISLSRVQLLPLTVWTDTVGGWGGSRDWVQLRLQSVLISSPCAAAAEVEEAQHSSGTRLSVCLQFVQQCAFDERRRAFQERTLLNNPDISFSKDLNEDWKCRAATRCFVSADEQLELRGKKQRKKGLFSFLSLLVSSVLWRGNESQSEHAAVWGARPLLVEITSISSLNRALHSKNHNHAALSVNLHWCCFQMRLRVDLRSPTRSHHGQFSSWWGGA